MTDAEWRHFVKALVNAKRELGEAHNLLDGIDGATEAAAESFGAALREIDAIYAAEILADEYNPASATPLAVADFWKKHDSLPGFAVGT